MANYKILVPVDFSNSSIHAFEAARDLATLLGGRITPYHAMLIIPDSNLPKFPAIPELQIDYEQLGKDLKPKLELLARRYVSSRLLNAAVISKGLITPSIIEASSDHDFIVMSSHGRSGYKRYIMGSVAEEVLRSSKVPVLIVKKTAQLQPLNKLLVCTDYSKSSRASFSWAMQIAQKAHAEIDLVHITSAHEPKPGSQRNTRENERRITSLADRHFSSYRKKVKPGVIYSDSPVHEALSDLINHDGYSLVVMATLGHSELDYTLMGSTTANVVRFSESPVLVVRPVQP